MIYENGIENEVVKNYDEAIKHYEIGAKLLDNFAVFRLGYVYQKKFVEEGEK